MSRGGTAVLPGSTPATPRVVTGRGASRLWIATLAGALTLLGLFARIMSYPLRHDEEMYVPAGILFSPGSLYQEHGYNHLPNLPILLHVIFAVFGVDHYILVGRLVIFAGWLGCAAALLLIARRATGGIWPGAVGFLVLATNTIAVGQAGMLISNNMLPVPFALFGLYAYLCGVDRPRAAPGLAALAGFLIAVAIGFKVNYVFLLPPFAVAALLAPAAAGFGDRLRRVVLPMLTGAIVGGLPTLYFLAADPDGFLAHVVRYHRGPHAAYSLAADDAQVFTLWQKALLAENVWLSGSILVVAIAAVVFAVTIMQRRSAGLDAAPQWPIALVVGLVLCGTLVSFVPTPSFPQYFLPPVPFVIVLAILLYGRLDASERRTMQPLVTAVALIAAIVGLPRLAADLPNLVRPGHWTGNSVHALAGDVGARVRAAGAGTKVATLSPVFALEAGLDIYPELAGGPFVYRVAELIPAEDRKHYRLVSEATLARRLDAEPPAAIITGVEDGLDRRFDQYAADHGYVRAPLANAETHDGTVALFLRPKG